MRDVGSPLRYSTTRDTRDARQKAEQDFMSMIPGRRQKGKLNLKDLDSRLHGNDWDSLVCRLGW